MGYTHYWRKVLELDQDKFNQFVEDCKEIIKYAKKEFDINICNWEGIGEPEYTSEFVSFNGDHSKDDGCETFRFTRKAELEYANEYGLVFDCTKTARNPYDCVVTACLIAAKYHFDKDIYISSDGSDEPEMWINGFLIASAILGINQNEMAQKLFEKPSKDMIKPFHQKLIEIEKEMMKGKPVPGSISSKDTAKLIRADLKKAFPDNKFSIRSDYDSIRVNWKNGPCEEKVKKILDKYQRGHIERITDWFTWDSSPYNNKYLFYQREIDHDIVLSEAKRISEDKWGFTLPEDTTYYNLYNALWIEGDKRGFDLQRDIIKAINSQDY
jgi:hypothetical protein